MIENELLEEYYEAKNTLLHRESFDGFLMLQLSMKFENRDFVTREDFKEAIKNSHDYINNRQKRKNTKGMN